RHDAALREAAEDDPLEREAVEEVAERVEACEEVLVGRRRNAAERVPVRAARRQRERAARRVAVQPPFGIERVEQREEIVLVGAAPVQQDECALRLTRGGALKK